MGVFILNWSFQKKLFYDVKNIAVREFAQMKLHFDKSRKAVRVSDSNVTNLNNKR